MALTIGQVATAADVNIQTIRYYERRATPSRACKSLRILARSVSHPALAAPAGVVPAVVPPLSCVGPLLAVPLALSGAGLPAMFEPLRPYFVAGTVLALGFGFVVLRSEEKRACEPDTLCASPIARRRMKWALWTATILSIPLLTFPWWSKFLLS